jgi:site-specific recombinase XerD
VGEQVCIYQRRGSRNWYAYYRQDGRVVRRSLKTRYQGKARKCALELEKQLLEGSTVKPSEPPLIANAVKEYMAHLRGLQRSKKTLQKYQHCFKLVLERAAELNVTRLHQINHRFIDAFRTRRVEAEAEPKTVKNDVVTIRQLINFALRRELLADDPLKGLVVPEAPHRTQPCWTASQVERILNAAKAPYRQYFECLWLTGMRASEAVWLTWDDVDFDNGVIRIRAKDGWQPKTGDERVIPMGAPLRRLLEQQPRQWRWVLTAKPSAKCPQPGRQISIRRALSHLKTVLKRLGLKGHLHTYRHSFVSHALTSGVPEAIVRSWVGHVDHRILKTYTHVADQISQDAMRNLFAADGEPDGQSPASA